MTGVGEELPGAVEAPRSARRKHECPPERVAMLERLEELEKTFNQRLVQQKEVIENLSQARQAILDQLHAWQEIGKALASARHLTHMVEAQQRAGVLLRQQGVES